MRWGSAQGGLWSCLLDHRGSWGRCRGAIGPQPSETSGPLPCWRAALVSAIRYRPLVEKPLSLCWACPPRGTSWATSQIPSISSTQRACRMLCREAPLLTSPPALLDSQAGSVSDLTPALRWTVRYESQWSPGVLPRVHRCSGKHLGPSRRLRQNCLCKPCFVITGLLLKGPGSDSSAGLRV